MNSSVPKKVKFPNTPKMLGYLAETSQQYRDAQQALKDGDPLNEIFEIRATLREWAVTDSGHCIFRREVLDAFRPGDVVELGRIDIELLALGCLAECGEFPLVDGDLESVNAAVDVNQNQ